MDPWNGNLVVEVEDSPSMVRSWRDGGWWLEEEMLTPSSDAPHTEVRYEWTEERLSLVRAWSGIQCRYQYDDQGRLHRLVWADGARVLVGYDEQGRVDQIEGPGPGRVELNWGNALVVRDWLGRTQSLEWGSVSGGWALEVRDAQGRMARTFYADPERRELLGWEDPRGGRTRVSAGTSGVDLFDASGRLWSVQVDEQHRPLELVAPGGLRWSWSRDESGRLVRLVDPTNRITRWVRNGDGEVIQVVSGGRKRAFQRDGDGRVSGLVDPTGAVTRIVRDDDGRIIRLIDAVGGELVLERGRGAWPDSIVGRSGAVWKLDTDLLGRPQLIRDPTGRQTRLLWGSGGVVVGVEDSVQGLRRWGRTADGRIQRVEDADGRITSIQRDAVGRIQSIRRPDGSLVQLRRDPAGDLSAVSLGGEKVEVRRDPVGQVLSAGDLSWTRDSSGRVVKVEAPDLVMALQRDGAGRILGIRAARSETGIQRDPWELKVERNRSGQPISWSGTDQDTRVVRDQSGRVISDTTRTMVSLHRDPRGLVEQVKQDGMEWRWLRDASGRVLRMVAPWGLSVGVDRDIAGRPTMVRYPHGLILRRQWEGALLQEVLLDVDSQPLHERTSQRGMGEDLQWTNDSRDDDRIWRHDPLGSLVAIEDSDGGAWSWTPDGLVGPMGELVAMDEVGRIAEARVPAGPMAWGVAEEALSVARDTGGRMVHITGDQGSVVLSYDLLGRLSEVDLVGPGGMSMEYDGWGRLVRVEAEPTWGDTSLEEALGILPVSELTWGPTGLLASGSAGTQVWVHDGEHVAGTAREDQVTALVVFDEGVPEWRGTSDERTRIGATPTGFPRTQGGGLAGAMGTFQLFPGGPLWSQGVWFDPVSGQALVPSSRWQWMPPAGSLEVTTPPWDPTGWTPESPWSRPLELLESLGGLASVDEGAWSRREEEESVVPWLPRRLDGDRPPLGPAPDDWPFLEDPVTWALLESVVPGADSPPQDLVLSAVMGWAETVEVVPPGLEIAGFHELFPDP